MTDEIKGIKDYQYGFADKDTSVYKTNKGINEDIVKEISKIKNEPEWMTEFRLIPIVNLKKHLYLVLALIYRF